MMGPMRKRLKKHLSEDTSYKVVALFVTLVLWVTILGRKNSVVSKDFDLEILVRNSHIVSNEIRRKVRVQLSGPRMILKKYVQGEQTYTIDLWDFEAGKHKVRLTKNGLNLPVGLKVLSVSPKEIMVVIRDSGNRPSSK